MTDQHAAPTPADAGGQGAPQPPPPPPPPPPPAPAPPYAPQPAQQQQQQPHYSQQGQQYFAQPAAPVSQAGQPGDLMTRFLARFIDNLLLGVIAMIIFFFIGFIAAAATVNSVRTGGGGGGVFVVPFLISAISSLIIAAVMLGYFTFMESSRGQTFGKMAMKLKTYGPTGENPTTSEAMKRNIWMAAPALGVVPFAGTIFGGFGVLIAVITIAVTINNNSATGQGWHDTFAGGTRVIKTG